MTGDIDLTVRALVASLEACPSTRGSRDTSRSGSRGSRAPTRATTLWSGSGPLSGARTTRVLPLSSTFEWTRVTTGRGPRLGHGSAQREFLARVYLSSPFTGTLSLGG